MRCVCFIGAKGEPHIGHEVFSIGAGCETLLGSFRLELQRLLLPSSETRYQNVQELDNPEEPVPVSWQDETCKFEAAEDVGNPEVILALLERAKGIAKGQIPDYVKCDEVEPRDKVDSALVRAVNLLHELVDEEINILGDQRLLLSQSSIREGMGQ